MYSLVVICQEKTIEKIGEFDKSTLNATETVVKNPLPDASCKQNIAKYQALFLLNCLYITDI